MGKYFLMIAMILVSFSVYAGNKDDLAYLGYNELDTVVGLTSSDEVIVVENDIPKKGTSIASVLALVGTAGIAGTGTQEISGMLTDVEVGVTADTLLVSETGRVNVITTASTKILPLAAAGLQYTFVSGDAVAMTIDPNVADTIKVDTHVLDAGDKAVTVAATGNTIILYGTATANTWYAVCYPDACTDGGA